MVLVDLYDLRCLVGLRVPAHCTDREQRAVSCSIIGSASVRRSCELLCSEESHS
jgi:hypothetical protein